MKYDEKRKVEKDLKQDIEDLKEFDTVEHYIEANFQMFCRQGEYDDNSIDLAYHYNMLKEIEADERFNAKLYFVLSRYVKSPITTK